MGAARRVVVPTLPSLVDGSVVLRERRRTGALALMLGLALLACVGIHWGSLRGQFLSDDFGFPWGLYHAANGPGVWSWVWDAVIVREPQPGNFYRPLGFLSFALNWGLGGAAPIGWRLFNLLLHLGNGLLLYRLLRRVAGPAPQAGFAATLAAALFWLYPLAPEVSAWVCARFDALALAGLLIGVERHLASRRRFDGAHLASLVALALALASKESALTAPAFLLLLDVAADTDRPWRARLQRALLRLLPALALLAAYLAWRRMLFGGSAVEVYAHSAPLSHLAPLELWRHLIGMAPIPREALGATLGPLLAATAALLALAAVSARRAGRFLDHWLLPALAFAAAVAAVLPHFSGSLPNGEGARLFYLAGAWLALWMALPLAHLGARALRALAAAVVLLAFAAGQAQAMVPWRKAALAMRGVIDAVPATATRLRRAQAHGLILLPDHWRTAPFARNAQIAPLVPPYQAEDFRDVLSVFTPPGMAEWAQRVRDADLPWSGGTAASLRCYCFDADTRALVPLSLSAADAGDADTWSAAWQRALAASPCADEYRP